MSQMTAPKISVLGDGISSFEGYVPRQASFYSPSYVSYSGFDSPEGTWWICPPLTAFTKPSMAPTPTRRG